MMQFFSLQNKFLFKLLGVVVLLTIVMSCKKENVYKKLPVNGPDQDFYALSTDNGIYRFNAQDVKSIPTKIAITGLAPDEKILSIDFRPATGELYGVSTASKIYVIDASGAVRLISTNAFNPGIAQDAVVSLDFDPTTDQMRIVTNKGQNLRINPEDGVMISSDPTLIGDVTIFGAAYNNSKAGSKTATLYDIDTKNQKLYKQEPANSGQLVAIGNFDLNLGTNVSFDISADNSNAMAIGKVGDSTKLFTIDLTTGKAQLKGNFPLSASFRGIAMPPDKVAYAVDNANNFLIFNPDKGNATTAIEPVSIAIKGLQAGETVVGMDMRPLNGRVYALGSSSRLYRVNLATAEFTQIGSGAFTTLLNGTNFGFDFDPISDRIRVVSNTGQNLRINPSDAVVTNDPGLSPSGVTIGAAAFSNNFKGANTTTLYVIDYATDRLYTQEPISGVLTEVGALKVDATGANGFDIISTLSTNTGYALLTVGTETRLYYINLITGEASLTSKFSINVTAFTLGLRFYTKN
ncbi:DUF4394 domain-containing protein [Pedobacter sp. Hv1]|uniref:DUF4394 domain-containing protein n=1 Tax=Pedobacter sp. Hv1 TaxID=1740090 RepID=UPI0006D8CE74|nr:DUF4394 domain-containing protein [Pedobacter sp. Hv1]KQB98874.1 hypothetical protein AQF98_21280 [Pedobacter sp. Hv1]